MPADLCKIRTLPPPILAISYQKRSKAQKVIKDLKASDGSVGLRFRNKISKMSKNASLVTPNRRPGCSKMTPKMISNSAQNHPAVSPNSSLGHTQFILRSAPIHPAVSTDSSHGQPRMTRCRRQIHPQVSPKSSRGQHALILSSAQNDPPDFICFIRKSFTIESSVPVSLRPKQNSKIAHPRDF